MNIRVHPWDICWHFSSLLLYCNDIFSKKHFISKETVRKSGQSNASISYVQKEKIHRWKEKLNCKNILVFVSFVLYLRSKDHS